MKFGVVIFPGSNCDEDIIYVLEKIMGQQVVRLWHKDHDLQGVDFIVLPGGFSFGDYLRSGAIARFSPIMQEVIRFAGQGGYVLGICNGFQILTEAGLVPGALLHNKNRKFICRNTYIKAQTNNSLLTSQVDLNKALKIPVAHGEGNFYADKNSIEELKQNDQILFRYCDAAGNYTDEANANGSIQNIAGVCNKARNVFGLMPHPERAADSLLANQDGLAIFESILSVANA
ncbi:MAG: phosphoribosylformylglycinamidine synthase subunit PurQ [Mucilaginibacter sp.]|uniref:phosphoribosylformylglycinamidine synthase subunit PurQ n=1 Tax=Mucilaginibacter sp. TaxID=1882438 RepID=UPI0034E45BD5